MSRLAAVSLSLLLLAGCAADTDRYPSLAPRAAEKRGFEEPIVPVAVAAADPTLDASLAAQATSLDRIAAGFTKAAEAARRDARAGKVVVGSDAWLTAQTALARADDWRAQATALAAEIDAAASARAAKLLPPYPALETLRERAATETEREAQTAGELQALLPAG